MSDPSVYRRLDELERMAQMRPDRISSAAPTYTAPTLLNSWVNFGGGFTSAGYTKDALGFVFIRGLIKNGTATGGTVLFVLPAGYRPSSTMVFVTTAYTAASEHGELRIETGGNVTINAGGNGYFSLSVPPFLAEA